MKQIREIETTTVFQLAALIPNLASLIRTNGNALNRFKKMISLYRKFFLSNSK